MRPPASTNSLSGYTAGSRFFAARATRCLRSLMNIELGITVRALARALVVALKVDVIVAGGTPAALAAKQATRTIQFGRESREPLELPLGISVFDREVVALDIIRGHAVLDGRPHAGGGWQPCWAPGSLFERSWPTVAFPQGAAREQGWQQK